MGVVQVDKHDAEWYAAYNKEVPDDGEHLTVFPFFKAFAVVADPHIGCSLKLFVASEASTGFEFFHKNPLAPKWKWW